MPGAPHVYGDDITLRPVEPADHEFLAKHWNHPDVRHGTNKHEPVTVQSLVEGKKDDCLYFLICHDGEPVGMEWLELAGDVHRRAELGGWVVPEESGQGFATAAARLSVEYGFDELNLHKVYARVFDYNEASKRLLRKVGFEEEGRVREHFYVDGEYVDAVFYGVLEPEYERER
ncbi:GNAT family N-acetyltransferase [Haloarcula pellucida]|uniref:N-acetyltransferase n=1 Tax=Haloarcula pellucida TaxID=1427151 RepID=A0A830GMK3_9EURY|nr:GNAT family protein [Halomicroarcula pellucida]MBX0349954.1 GNAT family N-acetyltransferase [Halomicroarcula pellucida]GGN95185.1 N-acetyltransferase [Halomicroarcula pellucida]